MNTTFLRFWLVFLVTIIGIIGWGVAGTPATATPTDDLPPIVFVARSHLATPDNIFQDELGPAGQFGTGIPKFAPNSKLVRRNPDGSLFVYNTPDLEDIQSPDVSFDGTKIIFAAARTLNEDSPNYGWRLYEINVDGSNLHQLTFSDRDITIPNALQFGNLETYRRYHDLFPAYLADGRIAFVSSRYPSRAHYDDRPSFNLYIMNGDGSEMHRVTTERAGVLHPTPLPDGRILLTRWWNQFNQPSETAVFNRIDNADTDQILADGTTILANPDEIFNPPYGLLADGYQIRGAPNTWHLMVINPDGTEFQRFVWTPRYESFLTDDSGLFDTYAASQPAPVWEDGQLYVAYTAQTDSTMVHSTLKTGIRVGLAGIEQIAANTQPAIAGLDYDQAWAGDESDPYALHPWGMSDGRILYSQSHEDFGLPTSGTFQEGGHSYELQGSFYQYELYLMEIDGSNKMVVPIDLGSIGMVTADAMDAKPIVARTGWVAMPDLFTAVANDDPTLGNVPNSLAEYDFSEHEWDEILTATIHNPNVYANASLYYPFVNNSPPPGSVAWAEVWIDANQFTGAYCYEGNPDYPQPCHNFRQDNEVRAVLWTRVAVDGDGAFTAEVPADTMGFIILRDSSGRVVRGWNRGYISIAQGSAWARPNETVVCTGCHMGHVSGSLADVLPEVQAGWTNIAPYAQLSASSYYPTGDEMEPFVPARLHDRRGWIPTADGSAFQDYEYSWISDLDSPNGEWIELNWAEPMRVKTIRLVGVPPFGGDWDGFGQPEEDGDYYVNAGTLRLYRQGELIATLSTGRIKPMTEGGGTLITLDEPLDLDQIRFTATQTTGRWWWEYVVALSEIEVIGRTVPVEPPILPEKLHLPLLLSTN